MNANNFLRSFIVGLAALGGYGQQVRAEPPTEIATAAEQPVGASGEASEEMREAKKTAGELMYDTVKRERSKRRFCKTRARALWRSAWTP